MDVRRLAPSDLPDDHRRPVLGLEVAADRGPVVVYPTGHDNNHVGGWPVSREDLAERAVGRFVFAFERVPRADLPHGHDHPPSRPRVEGVPCLSLAAGPPEVTDDGRVHGRVVNRLVPWEDTEGNGLGAFAVRDERPPEGDPDPEDVPTPEEVVKRHVGGLGDGDGASDLDFDEYADRHERACRVHEGAAFWSVVPTA